MIHPFIGDLSEMKMDELLIKINELNGKLMIARRMGNQPVVNQMYMILESYQTEYKKQLDKQYAKYNVDQNLIKINK